ncbi:MAG TPA: ABC transporter permease, partial [Desulfobacterales bacterium]|nr:ABC transporter permease [Desulfobacterales bacterium]
MGAVNIDVTRLALYYGLLIIPLGAMLWLRIPMVGKTL